MRPRDRATSSILLAVLAVGALVWAAGIARAAADPDPPLRVEAERLADHIRALPEKRSGAGDAEHLDGLVRTQTVLLERVRALGFEPSAQPVRWSRRDRPDSSREWVNIVFEIPGREQPKDLILIGAHFDAVPNAPGADDNGSGVAGLLEIARVLKDRPMRRTVRFALYNLEEVGLVGSTQHSAAWIDAREQHGETLTLMLSLEMLGFYSAEPRSQRNPFAQLRALAVPDRGDFIGIAALLPARPVIRVLEREMLAAEPDAGVFVFDYLPLPAPDILRSDNGPWMLAGLPAAMVTDTANFRNPNYHRPTDTLGALDLPRFARTVSALAAGVHALAGPVGQPDPAPADQSRVQNITPAPTRSVPENPPGARE